MKNAQTMLASANTENMKSKLSNTIYLPQQQSLLASFDVRADSLTLLCL